MAGKRRRVVLKLSGDALGPAGGVGIDIQRVTDLAERIKRAAVKDVEIALVIGAGNLVRGRTLTRQGINRTCADLMGMLATVMNGLALQDVLERMGLDTRLQSAVEMNTIAEPYVARRCIKHLLRDRLVIVAGGTGNPHFTTDTAAALRAREIEAECLLKGTDVEGVYSGDPDADPNAELLPVVGYTEYLSRDLKVMDATAVAMCREACVPIVVFNYKTPGNIERAVLGENVGTRIEGDCHAGG